MKYCLSFLFALIASGSIAQYLPRPTRKELVKNKIEKIVATRKYKMGSSTTTQMFDKKGNLVYELNRSVTKYDHDTREGRAEMRYWYEDTLCTRMTYKEEYPENGELQTFKETTDISYEFYPNGKLYITTQNADVDTFKTVFHYNEKGLTDTVWQCVSNSSKNYPANQNRFSLLAGFFVLRKTISTYDSRGRLTKEIDTLSRSRNKGPFFSRFYYLGDTVLQKNFHYEQGVLVEDSAYSKTYGTRNYEYRQEYFGTIKTYTQRNAAGLKTYEKEISNHQYNGQSIVETSYRYFYRRQ